jgi:hypothetical protein
MSGSTRVGSSCYYQTRVGVTDSVKHSSLLRFGVNYDHKKFCRMCPEGFPDWSPFKSSSSFFLNLVFKFLSQTGFLQLLPWSHDFWDNDTFLSRQGIEPVIFSFLSIIFSHLTAELQLLRFKNDTQHNDTQLYESQNNDSQHNDT